MAKKVFAWIRYGYVENNKKNNNVQKTTFAYFEIVGYPHKLTTANERTVKPYNIPSITIERVNTVNGVESLRDECPDNVKIGFVHPRRLANFTQFDYCVMIRDTECNNKCIQDYTCNKHTNYDRRCDSLIRDIKKALNLIETEGATPQPSDDIIWVKDNCKNPTVDVVCKCMYCKRKFGTHTTKKRYHDYYYNRRNVSGFVQDVSAMIEADFEHGIYWCDECAEKEEDY